jgi:hypothetical protein
MNWMNLSTIVSGISEISRTPFTTRSRLSISVSSLGMSSSNTRSMQEPAVNGGVEVPVEVGGVVRHINVAVRGGFPFDQVKTVRLTRLEGLDVTFDVVPDRLRKRQRDAARRDPALA